MVVETIKIPGELCGPSNTAHGGYVCGRLAKHIEGPATVRLMMGAPLDVPLRIETSNGEVRMFDQDTLIAEARGADMDLIPPSAPSFASAMEASKSFVAMERHPFARCFVCGPQRAPGDGMRIFPGAVQGQPLIAAPWVPNAAFAGGSDNICPEFIWAVLECTGGFAWYPQMVVLGELSGRSRVLYGQARSALLWDGKLPRKVESISPVPLSFLNRGIPSLLGAQRGSRYPKKPSSP